MKTNKSSVIDFLQRDYSFIIPVYQRHYDWEKEQCQRLFDDLLGLLPCTESSKYQFGHMACQCQSMRNCLIIDGQQRLTTISLLMLAMARMIEEGRLQPDDPRLAKRLRDKYLADYDDERQPKLKHTKDDATAFRCLLNDQDGPGNSRITLNYRYFRERLEKHCRVPNKERHCTPDQLFGAICTLQVEMSELDEDEDPQVIFANLNSTGRSLREGDNIRNYILMPPTNYAQKRLWYDDYLQPIEEACISADGRSALDDFLRDYLTAKTSKVPRRDKLYAAFRNYCDDHGDHLQVLREMHRYAVNYHILLQGGSTIPQLDACIRRLNYLKISVVRPYLLEVLEMHRDGRLTGEELLRIFILVESFWARRSVCGIKANALTDIFPALHRNILRDGGAEHALYMDRLSYHLISKEGARRFPDDREFRQALADMNVYALHTHSRLYLLERLENARTREQHEIYGNDDYSVEHIMPQTLNDEWKRDLGPDHHAIHERWLHRLANLTLTAYNAEYSNCSFTRKRDMEHGFRDSGLRLNSYLARLERWDEAALQARQEQLLDDALAIWPRPVSSYCPPRPPEERITLAEWYAGRCPDPSGGRKPLRCILLGQELQATSWKQVLIGVAEALHAQAPTVIGNIIHNDPPVNFSTREHDERRSKPYHRIDDDYYIYTLDLTSLMVMRLLCFLLQSYQIDLSALAIVFKPQKQAPAKTNDEHHSRRGTEESLLSIMTSCMACGHDSSSIDDE